MRPDLETVKNEIAIALEQSGFAVFHGMDRNSEPMSMVRWNAEKYPDPRLFLETARKTGVKIVVFQQRQFESAAIEETLEDLEAAALPREQHRDYERQLRKLHDYDGFTCMVELSYPLDGVWYVYQVFTPWFDDFLLISGQIQDLLDSADEDETEPGPLGGYFSHN